MPLETVTYATTKIPKSEIDHQEREKSIDKWQQQWDNTTKGLVTEEFFPNIKDRLKMKINLTPNFTTMVTAHGNTRSYLHRFKIIVSRMALRQRIKQWITYYKTAAN
jgi:hypothetical protein